MADDRQAVKRIGELLIAKGLITASQLEAALKEQHPTGDLLGAILLRNGWVTEEAFLKALGERFEIPYGRLEDEEVDWSVARKFPTSIAEHLCFPIRMNNETVTVAIANPLDAWVFTELENWIGHRKLDLLLVSERALREALRRSRLESLDSLLGEGEGSG